MKYYLIDIQHVLGDDRYLNDFIIGCVLQITEVKAHKLNTLPMVT